ncbi:MOSC and FAD-binding oxidoreductase domain-containing protein [Pseudofrankia inefficax]|uniref:MOSC domain-containing protein n=1 Tax=Pseudofrankia inefficax (strain DSM 45817 / CECT 9037 / DDB 130130 / EuI1c) TaxID=298654 RepID=UPI0018E01B9D|nr:MOSC and FAD-binding oxidoreductase domain-containing protein [Pseudofrankia inefficax]
MSSPAATLGTAGAVTTAGVLRSLNVGLPRDVAWHGRTVHTAVWKRPVDGPRPVRRLNIDGDGQGDLAGHGGEHRAVFVYQLGSYRYWREALGRDDLEPGIFGENFTVEGLADDEVCIGDRYRIGDAVFEVTQPRVTCYRVGIRLDDPQMPARLVAEHRPGFYFRVLAEGAVQAGDDIVKVGSGPEGMTVAEIDALLYLPGRSRHQVARALRIPALSPGWRSSFQQILEQKDGGGNAGLVAAGPPPAWSGFRRLAVARIEAETPTISSLYLADPGGAALPAALPGQFLTLRLRPGATDQPVLRNYSLSGAPGSGQYRISVKREPHGAGSGFLHARVRVGDELEVGAPRGTFTLRPGSAPVLLISAGVGATPVLAMLHALAAEKSGRTVWWLHGARTPADEAFAAESRALVASLPDARRLVCLSHPAPGHDVDDQHSGGRLAAPVLSALDLPRDAEAYLCGPDRFMADISAALVALGLDAGRIHTEIFGAPPAQTPGIAATLARPPHQPAGEPGTGPLISFARSALATRWDPSHGSLLDLAEACDVPVRWSCRTGVCHNCQTTVVAGTVRYSPEPVDPPADGTVLICCAQPGEDLTLDL